MTLRKKTLGVICSTILIMVVTIYSITRFILMDGYLQLEQNDILKTTDQVSKQLYDELSELERTALDWAPWDDTYQFVQDVNQTYIESNLADSTMVNLKINFMLFINDKKEIRHCKSVNLQTETNQECVETFDEFIITNSIFLRDNNNLKTISGFSLFENKIVLLASSPILTSKVEGPLKGTLIVGRYLNLKEIQRLSSKLNIPFEIKLNIDKSLIQISNMHLELASFKNKTIIKKMNKETITSLSLFNDINKRPVFAVKVEKERDLFKEGRKSLNLFFLSLIAVSLVFIMASLIFLEKIVLRRLFKLSEDVKRITTQNDRSERVSLSGNDEISSLSLKINQMLDTIGKKEKEKENLIDELTNALAEIKSLKGIVPICSNCKKIRDDKGYWNLLETFIEEHSEASFSHSMCPECSDKFYGEEAWYIKRKKMKKK